MIAMAFCASSALLMVTKPKPRGRLVMRSIIRLVSVTVPCAANASFRSTSGPSPARLGGHVHARDRLSRDQIAYSEEKQPIAASAAGRRVNDDGSLVGGVGTGKREVFHRLEVEPSLGGRAESQFMNEGFAAELVVARMSRPVGSILGSDLLDLHLNARGIAQVIRQAPRLS